MPHFVAAEQYGYPLDNVSEEAVASRANQLCPFRTPGKCNKKGGVCSITDGTSYPITCPERFKEADSIYEIAGGIVFGTTEGLVALSEIPFLESHDETGAAPGRIDNVLALYSDGKLHEWCALEVQAVYFSGAGMERELAEYANNARLPSPAQPLLNAKGLPETRRPDFRSSAPKRLLPQLEIKVPTLRRWGKKMCVVVDQPFFDWMPEMEPANHLSNADIIWIVFKLDTSVSPHRLVFEKSFNATLEESRRGLIAATIPPKPSVELKIARTIDRGLQGVRQDAAKIQWRKTD